MIISNLNENGFQRIFRVNPEKKLPPIKKEHNLEKNKAPEIRSIEPEEIEKIAYLGFKDEDAKIATMLTEQENRECLQKVIQAHEEFPEEVKKLFRYKTRGIYYLPNQYRWSGFTRQSKEKYGQCVIILNVKAVRDRNPSFVLIHELSHTIDYGIYPAAFTPKWAWQFIDEFETKILHQESKPIEGKNRDEENLFGDPREEWASRCAATIISLYLPDQPVTGLTTYPYTVEEFKKAYPHSFKFFKKYLRRLNQEIEEFSARESENKSPE